MRAARHIDVCQFDRTRESEPIFKKCIHNDRRLPIGRWRFTVKGKQNNTEHVLLNYLIPVLACSTQNIFWKKAYLWHITWCQCLTNLDTISWLNDCAWENKEARTNYLLTSYAFTRQHWWVRGAVAWGNNETRFDREPTPSGYPQDCDVHSTVWKTRFTPIAFQCKDSVHLDIWGT